MIIGSSIILPDDSFQMNVKSTTASVETSYTPDVDSAGGKQKERRSICMIFVINISAERNVAGENGSLYPTDAVDAGTLNLI